MERASNPRPFPKGFSVSEEYKVAFVPTAHNLVDAMLNMADLNPTDVLIDLGSGDGRIVIAAAKRGIKAIGIECDSVLIATARAKAAEEVEQPPFPVFIEGDLYETSLLEATVVTVFLDRPYYTKLLRKFVNQLRPGTRIISNTFYLWEQDREVEMDTKDHFTTARMWRVP
jgi:Predicted O-methyltransferase